MRRRRSLDSTVAARVGRQVPQVPAGVFDVMVGDFTKAANLVVRHVRVAGHRDVGDDARRGRIYLPQDELARFGVKPSSILAGAYTTIDGPALLRADLDEIVRLIKVQIDPKIQ